jgi:hypothetical protein
MNVTGNVCSLSRARPTDRAACSVASGVSRALDRIAEEGGQVETAGTLERMGSCCAEADE